jgi:hypothetical protein
MNNSGGDIGRSTERKGTGSGDSYKVLLVDDPRHTEELGKPHLILFLFLSTCFQKLPKSP